MNAQELLTKMKEIDRAIGGYVNEDGNLQGSYRGKSGTEWILNMGGGWKGCYFEKNLAGDPLYNAFEKAIEEFKTI